jgi:hypothetical protein
MGYQTYEIYTDEFGEFPLVRYYDLILAGLPFFMVALVQLAVIPLCKVVYEHQNKLKKTLFLVGVILISLINFETLALAFERQFNNMFFEAQVIQKKLIASEEKIQFNEDLIENVKQNFADADTEEQQNLKKLRKDNNDAIKVYEQNIRDREKLIEAIKEDGSLGTFFGGTIGKLEKEIEEFENKISQLFRINSRWGELQIVSKNVEIEKIIFPITIELEELYNEKISLYLEIKEAYEGTQIYRIGQSFYGLENDGLVTMPQLAIIAKLWFGTLAGILVLLPILLAFGGFRLKKTAINKVGENGEIIKEVIVEKEVIKEVPVEVHVPIYTNDPDLLKAQEIKDNKEKK